MKKNFKVIMLALIVSFAFVISACGAKPDQLDVGATANIGTAESYQTATATDVAILQTYTESDTATEVNSYRMTMTMKIGNEVIMAYNAILSYSSDDCELAVKMTTDADEDGKTEDMFMYIQDGYVYGQMGDLKYKAQIENDDDLVSAGLSELFAMNLDSILDLVKEVTITTENLKVSTEGNVTRFALTESGSTMYLIFESGKLTQCAVDFEELEMTTSVIIEEYNQTIQFPDFSDYTLMPLA